MEFMKIVALESYTTESLQILRDHKHDVTFDKEALQEANVLLIRSQTQVNNELLAKAPQLQLIVTATAGFDHIDVESCLQKGVQVGYTPAANAASAAELTLALMLIMIRDLNNSSSRLQRGKWRTDFRKGHELGRLTVGVVGLGQVGQRVARYVSALGCSVVAHDPYMDDKAFSVLGVERMGYTELLAAVDLVTFHVPLTNETYRMLSRATLDILHENAFVVNASRGAVLDEQEVVKALDMGHLAGVAMDVFCHEPPDIEDPLLLHPKVVHSPHLGAYTIEAYTASCRLAVDTVLQFERGMLPNEVQPQLRPWYIKSQLPKTKR